jgi:hypothetical protein
LPSKLDYIEGETIQFGGLAVQAYTADGNVWTVNNHPNGMIPFGELFFPETIAHGEYEEEYTSDLGTYSLNSSFIIGEPTVGKFGWTGTLSKGIFYKDSGSWIEVVAASKTPGGVAVSRTYYNMGIDGPIVETESFTANNEFTHKDKTVYFYSGSWGLTGGPGDVPYMPGINKPWAAWTMIYGEDISREGTMEVPVQWFRPGDGQMLSTSYTIHVTKDGSGSGGSAEETQAINYNGTRYVANEDMNAEAHYQSGTVWIRGEAKVWSVPDAVAFGLLKPEEEKDGGSDSGSEHEGGHF